MKKSFKYNALAILAVLLPAAETPTRASDPFKAESSKERVNLVELFSSEW